MSKEVMRQALEALENSVDLVREDAYEAEKLYGNYPTRQGKVNGLKVLADDHEKAIIALREALAEQPAQQEPVTWGVDWGKAGDISCVSIIKRLPDGRIEVVAVEYAPYSYTSPPAQRTWVGLTDEDVRQCSRDVVAGGPENSVDRFAYAIEAKLKEKNT